MSSWGAGFPRDWLGDAAIEVARRFQPGPQTRAQASYARDVAAAAGPQLTPRRVSPLERLSQFLGDFVAPEGSAASREVSENLQSSLETALGFLSPSGAPATVAGRIPVEVLEDIYPKIMSKLSKEFARGKQPTTIVKGNQVKAILRSDADAELAERLALEQLTEDAMGEINDEVLAQGPDAIRKHLYNRAYREAVLKVRRDPEHQARMSGQYDDMFDEAADEGAGISTLENLPAAGIRADFKGAEDIAESISPMSGNVKERAAAEVARTTAETEAATKMSQILERILNPRQRYLLTQLDTPSKQLAQELYKLKPGQKVPQWMYESIRVDKLQAQQVARGATAPGIVTHLGAAGSGKQWEVVRTALRELKPPDLQARLGVLPERLREPAREFATRSMPLGNLLRKYKKTGLTREELYDAVQRLTHAPKE